MKYFNGIISLVMVVMLSGCDNFLQPEPETFETDKSFFTNDDQFLQSVNGAYARLQDWVLQAHVMEEGRSDNTTYDNLLNNGVLEPLVFLDRFQLNASSPAVSQAWNVIYRGIKDANTPLSQLESAKQNGNIDEDLGIRLEGELKFLRAFFHFTAVRFWGDVPLILEPQTSGLEAFEITQTPKEEVLDAIIQDLLDAEAILPGAYTGGNIGRITSGTVKTLLAKVYLWTGNYNGAESKLREIVDSGQYSLLQNYADIFDPQNKNNAESIYEVPFQEDSEGEASNFIYQFAPVGSLGDIILAQVGDGTWGRNLPTLDMVDSYEANDVRKDVSIGFFERQEDNTRVPYIKKWDHDSNQDFARTPDNWPLYRYADVLLMLAEAINEQGYDPGESLNLLNQVRNRANISPLTPADVPDQETFREALFHERRVELAFENHRWFDLIRFGVAVETMIAHGESEKDNPTTPPTVIQPLGPDTYMVEPYMLLYPIPDDEISVNPNMEQNPGY